MQQRTSQVDSPGLTVIPPKIFLLCFMVGVVLEFMFPTMHLWGDSFMFALGGTSLVVFGIFIMSYAHTTFKRNKTHTSPYKPAAKLVNFGIYTISRNPMYVGSIIIFAGLALSFSSLWLTGSVVAIWCYLQWYVIPKEEAYMERAFGDEYTQYKKTVRRWI